MRPTHIHGHQPDYIDEIKVSRFFSVLADEVSSHKVEHLAICLRFVYASCDIREEFIGFVKMERVRALDIAEAIIQSLGLSLSNLRGQGYDGTSTMSGERAGVQARILEKQPKAIYIHCAGHSLTLSAHAREGYSSHFVCLFWIVEKAPFSGLKLTSVHSR